jgi:hypothetical protein
VAAASGFPYFPGPYVLDPDQADAQGTPPIVALDDTGDTAVMAVTRAGGGTVVAQVFARMPSGQMTVAALLTNIESALSGGVAISGDGTTVVVDFIGTLEVFTKPSSPQGWFDQQGPSRTFLGRAHPQQGDNFGASIAVDRTGSTIVVGAPCSSNLRCGTAYVYTRGAGGWTAGQTETAQLSATVDLGLGPVPVKSLGFSVGIDGSGQNIIAGAPDFLPGALGPGEVYLFHLPPAGWVTTSTPTARLASSDGVVGDQLGWSAAISSDGSTVVAGAPANPATPSPPTGPGAAYVYVQPTPGGWASLDASTARPEDAKLTASHGHPNDGFGLSVSVPTGGSPIVVGAPNAPFTSGQPGGGVVSVYPVPTAGWSGGAGHPMSEAQTVTAYAGRLYGWFSSGQIASTPHGSFGGTQGLAISSDGSTMLVGGLADTAPTFPPNPILVLYEYK